MTADESLLVSMQLRYSTAASKYTYVECRGSIPESCNNDDSSVFIENVYFVVEFVNCSCRTVMLRALRISTKYRGGGLSKVLNAAVYRILHNHEAFKEAEMYALVYRYCVVLYLLVLVKLALCYAKCHPPACLFLFHDWVQHACCTEFECLRSLTTKWLLVSTPSLDTLLSAAWALQRSTQRKTLCIFLWYLVGVAEFKIQVASIGIFQPICSRVTVTTHFWPLSLMCRDFVMPTDEFLESYQQNCPQLHQVGYDWIERNIHLVKGFFPSDLVGHCMVNLC